MNKQLLAAFVFSLVLLSRTPTIYYLGDTYPPSSSIAVYYDAKEIKREYKIIGRMTKEVGLKTEQDKLHMVEAAKKRGADGIIFSELLLQPDKKQSDLVAVKAELIKFL